MKDKILSCYLQLYGEIGTGFLYFKLVSNLGLY